MSDSAGNHASPADAASNASVSGTSALSSEEQEILSWVEQEFDRQHPGLRPPSPVWGLPGPVPDPTDPVWAYDADMYGSGWQRADGIGATYMMNAAYDEAMHWGYRVRRLNMKWHRDGEGNVFMYGHNARGDIAPSQVHAVLDKLLQEREPPASFTELELAGLHARIDLIWLRHSRSPHRLPVALVLARAFSRFEIVRLHEVMHEQCLEDFREVMLCVDPRKNVEYGRTLTSEGISRRWKDILWGTGEWQGANRSPAGSSRDGDSVPYTQSPLGEALQDERFAKRRTARAMEAVRGLNAQAQRIDAEIARLTQVVDSKRALLDLLFRGTRVPADKDWTASFATPADGRVDAEITRLAATVDSKEALLDLLIRGTRTPPDDGWNRPPSPLA